MVDLQAIHSVPLTKGDDGAVRITGSRITLDSLVRAFQQGATAEQIQEDFPSLSLREIYGAIAYYLEHVEAVNEYLQHRGREAAQLRQEIENRSDSTGLRQRMRQRRAQIAR